MACLAFSLILMIVLVGFISRAFIAQGIGIYWRVLIIAAIDGGIAMAAVLQFLLIEADSRKDFGERRLFWGLDSRWVSSPYPVVILVMIVVSGLQELGAVVTMYETSGYLGAAHYMSSPPQGCEGKVLWIGERALVITCSRDRLQRYAVVGALNAPNLVICEFPIAGPGSSGAAGSNSSAAESTGCAVHPAPQKSTQPTPLAATVAPAKPPAEDPPKVRRPRRRPPPSPQTPDVFESPPTGAAGGELARR
jgi:hypothetical protein